MRPDSLPEFHEAIGYTRPDSDVNPIFPMMFISIACGAISGFHATQSPMMARCLKNEKWDAGYSMGQWLSRVSSL